MSFNGEQPELMTLKEASQQRDYVSRCSVCLKEVLSFKKSYFFKKKERTEQFVIIHTEEKL